MRPKTAAARPVASASAARSSPSRLEAASSADCSISAASASVTSSSLLSRRLPVRKSTAFLTSSALPAADANGSFIPVTSAVVLRPAPVATSTRLDASAAASRGRSMKAPLPTLTSRTSEPRPAASFLDRIDAVIRGTDSTVAVTSRMA